ncbi:CAP domain-containing protein [Marinibacterium profundimaris]|uniref:CAP domain-containing protein n=1 Tax=Marinibacterium profundimaris TaxID=1679460 RepID=UPI000B527926|nr:CAP domain-containing protein [Marinibacterium profundimaris]
MSRRSLGALVLPLAGRCAAPADLPPKIVGLPPGAQPARLDPGALELINRERVARGLPELRFDPRVGEAALAHASDMARTGFMGHAGSDGAIAGERLSRARYPWGFAAENVAHGYRDAAGVVAGWMGSEGHREAILSQAEVAAVARAGPEDAAYWTAVFAGPC